jgi:hypothetical protein
MQAIEHSHFPRVGSLLSALREIMQWPGPWFPPLKMP